MATKFDSARMQDIVNRLDEIQEQLNKNVNDSNTHLTQISSNITGEAVKTILKSFTDNNSEILAKTNTQIGNLKEYLKSKIGDYVATEEEAKVEMNNILSGLTE